MDFTITCPCDCGSTVEAFDSGFQATDIKVTPCKRMKAEDTAIVSYYIRKSEALSRSAVEVPVYRHRDGLVTFGSGDRIEIVGADHQNGESE